MLTLLFSDPTLFIVRFLALVYAITVHEFGHALAGSLQGDDTAKNAGRLTLNPLRHLDPMGTLVILLTGFFGWGKPTPYNPYNLKNRKYGSLIVGLAGPAMNLVSIVLFGSVFRWIYHSGSLMDTALFDFIVTLTAINLVLMVFNLIPIPPLDGSKFLDLLIPARNIEFKAALLRYGPMILMGVIFLDYFTGLGLLSRLFSSLLNWTFALFI